MDSLLAEPDMLLHRRALRLALLAVPILAPRQLLGEDYLIPQLFSQDRGNLSLSLLLCPQLGSR